MFVAAVVVVAEAEVVARAGVGRQDAGELPVVDDVADRLHAGAGAGSARSGISHTAFDLSTWRWRSSCSISSSYCALVEREADRAVRLVLEALLGQCCRSATGQRVVGAEREAVLEAALERRLDGVIVVPERGRVLVDVAEAAERFSRLSGGVGARARAGAERRVLVLRQERGAEVDRVQVDGLPPCRPPRRL